MRNLFGASAQMPQVLRITGEEVKARFVERIASFAKLKEIITKVRAELRESGAPVTAEQMALLDREDRTAYELTQRDGFKRDHVSDGVFDVAPDEFDALWSELSPLDLERSEEILRRQVANAALMHMGQATDAPSLVPAQETASTLPPIPVAQQAAPDGAAEPPLVG